jgi:hypothetical protein
MTNTQKAHKVYHHDKFQDMAALAESFLKEVEDLASDGDMQHAPADFIRQYEWLLSELQEFANWCWETEPDA